MKEIVMGALHELEKDLQEIARLRFQDNDDDQHTFNALALRVRTISELVDKYFTLTDESAKNAVRWKFLFQTAGVSFKFNDGAWTIYKDVVQDGEITGRKLLAMRDSLPKAVDGFLGFR